jgi:hypothetical protein
VRVNRFKLPEPLSCRVKHLRALLLRPSYVSGRACSTVDQPPGKVPETGGPAILPRVQQSPPAKFGERVLRNGPSGGLARHVESARFVAALYRGGVCREIVLGQGLDISLVSSASSFSSFVSCMTSETASVPCHADFWHLPASNIRSMQRSAAWSWRCVKSPEQYQPDVALAKSAAQAR